MPGCFRPGVSLTRRGCGHMPCLPEPGGFCKKEVQPEEVLYLGSSSAPPLPGISLFFPWIQVWRHPHPTPSCNNHHFYLRFPAFWLWLTAICFGPHGTLCDMSFLVFCLPPQLTPVPRAGALVHCSIPGPHNRAWCSVRFVE